VDRFTKITTSILDHRKFWEASHRLSLEHLAMIEERIAVTMVAVVNLDVSALALDMTNSATYLDSANQLAPISWRGKAKQTRADLGLVGLGPVITRDGGIPLPAHAYPGNSPEITQFRPLIDALGARHRKPADLAGSRNAPVVTAVFDAGKIAASNNTYVTYFDLVFGGLAAAETRRVVYGTERQVILTHPPTLHHNQAANFAQTLAKAQEKLADMAGSLARDNASRTTPATHRLSVGVNEEAHQGSEDEVFGKGFLVTTHENWPVAEVAEAYRSQPDTEFGLRQFKDPHVVSFSPMNH
jgi:hypothetical protein